MMIHVYEVGTGRLTVTCEVQTVEGADLQAETQGRPCRWIEGHWNPATSYVRGGQVVDRPVVEWPGHDALSALPRGTVVTVANEVGNTLRLTDLSDPLILTDPGLYRFDIEPPFPFLGLTTEVHHA